MHKCAGVFRIKVERQNFPQTKTLPWHDITDMSTNIAMAVGTYLVTYYLGNTAC